MNTHPHFPPPIYNISSVLASLPILLNFLYSSPHEVLPLPPTLTKGGMKVFRVNEKHIQQDINPLQPGVAFLYPLET